MAGGKIERLENFHSEFVTAGNIDIWLPENYTTGNKYRVIYMHDGQNLFDSTKTWNNKEWKVDEVLSKLVLEKKVEPCIVVGIWNVGEERLTDYFPGKIFEKIDPEVRQQFMKRFGNGKTVNGDNYLKFIVEELKPYIDRHYSTLPGKANNLVMGSSIGALISLYAVSEYPETFGGAG